MAVSDFNGDGKLDVVAEIGHGNQANGRIGVLIGNGDGTFRALQTFMAGIGPRWVAVTDANGDGRPDVLVTNMYDGTVGVFLGASNAGFVGQTYTIVPPALDTVTGTSGDDQITLRRDVDQMHVDWFLGNTSGQLAISDVNGLTLNGNGGNDAIALDYTNGNPLPNTLHSNGTFTVSGLQGATPLGGTNIEIGQSTVYFAYSGGSPVGEILAALGTGYNGGTWNGSGAGTGGAITSGAASTGPSGVFGIGYADSADGLLAGQPSNTVEVRYTVMGDTNLDRVVDSTDAITMARNYLIAGKSAWDLGNFNYDNTINYSDALILQKNFKVSVPAGTTAATAGPVPATTTTTAGAVNAGAGATSAADSGTADSGQSELVQGYSGGGADSTAGHGDVVDKRHPKHGRYEKGRRRG